MRAGMVITGIAASLVLTLALSATAPGSVPLPDGRAWEMVSPLEKNGGEINGIDGVVPDSGLPEGGIVQAAADGHAITYLSLLAFPSSSGGEPLGAPIASQYLSTRGGVGWSTENITAPGNSGSYAPAGSGAPYEAFSTDLSLGLMLNGAFPPVETPLLVPHAPANYQNYFLRHNATGDFEALLTSAPVEEPNAFFLQLLGIAPDLGHIVLGTPSALSAGAVRQERGNLYEWAAGQFQAINILPGVTSGETAEGGALLGMGADESRTISNDGSSVIWSQPASEVLYVRRNIGTADAETVQIDASQGPGPSGSGQFKAASADGSRVFFTDGGKLTADSTAAGGRAEDLYLFDVPTGHLSDLTVDGEPGGAAVQGVVEASEDGSYVYFVATGSLPGTSAVAGNNNLYVWHEGETKFIAALSSEDNGHGGLHEPGIAHDWDRSTGDRTARVSVDGTHLLFMSQANLTGYDNLDATTGLPDEEVYLYEALAARLRCVSCNPSGQRPLGSSGIPGGTPWRTVEELGTYQSRALSADGDRVFFDSSDALAAQDTNGVQDVYEWEEKGSGTCGFEGGCISLLSGAMGAGESSFVDAGASGEDVFFITRAQLVGQDSDQLRDLYDARVGGGFAQPAPAGGSPCEGEACLPGAISPPALGAPLSTTFSGAGNLLPPSAKPAVKAKKKKATAKKRKKARKRHARKRHAKKKPAKGRR